jgi:hypothetical protein
MAEQQERPPYVHPTPAPTGPAVPLMEAPKPAAPAQKRDVKPCGKPKPRRKR